MTAEEKSYLKSIGSLAIMSDTRAIEQKQDSFLSALDSKIKAVTGGGGAYGVGYSGWNRVLYRPFDGERNLGGMGPINKYFIDNESLRLRAWQLMLESEIVQIGVQRYVMWLIGGGLQLNSQPDTRVLKMFGITLPGSNEAGSGKDLTGTQKFSQDIESLWNLWSNNERSDKAGMETLHAKMFEAEINAIVAGDCLFKIDIGETGLPVVEIIDGSHVRTPMFSSMMGGMDTINPATGNRVRHGIEIDKNGQHVAFFVRKGNAYQTGVLDFMNYERIEARDKTTGYIRSYMYYGLRYRLSDIRGIPLIAVCMETTKQLERYKEATVDGAVQRAKVAIAVEHEMGAIGQNPFEAQLLKGYGGAFSDIPKDINGQNIQNTVAATSNAQLINMPVGGSLKAIESKQEIHFSEFFDTNLSILFAAIGIPKEIALMLFGSNYSASRASIKDWEHTLDVKRKKNVTPGYKHIYNIFLITQVLSGKINAPGYFQAIVEKNDFIQMAYENAEWIGDNPPDIDPKKEIEAARLVAGAGSTHLPFDTFANIMKRLGIRGDVRHIFDEYQQDIEYGDKIGIEKVEPARTTIEQFGEPTEDKPDKPGNKPVKTTHNERSSQTKPK